MIMAPVIPTFSTNYSQLSSDDVMVQSAGGNH